MGIHDREYARRAPEAFPQRAGRGIRGWSVTTWIIAVCIAVFALDEFLPRDFVPIRQEVAPEVWERLDTLQLRRGVSLRLPSGMVSTQLYVVEQGLEVPVGWEYALPMRTLERYLYFSTARGLVTVGPDGVPRGFEFWRLIGFQFLHANVYHLFFNMLGLFFFGALAEQHLGRKRYLAFYLLCGIFGALFYMVLNLGGFVASAVLGHDVRVPGLLFNWPETPLVGASAGVFGVIMAGAYLQPRAMVLLFFVIPMSLRTLAFVLVGVALLTVLGQGQNAGGEAAHLGGAAAGFYFIRHPRHLHGFFDFLGWIDPTSHHYRDRGRAAGQAGPAEVDRILAKVSARGLQSLSEDERRVLERASRR
jgi:membrane associated rhomboid family serine protease